MKTRLLHRCRSSFAAARLVTSSLLVALTFLSGCLSSRVPVTPGEIPAPSYVTPEDEAYGLEVLNKLSQDYPVEQNDRDVNRTRDIVDRLAKAAHASSSPWNVYVLRGDHVINAAATRGNFVFVWTGMLMATQNDADLATVLAHEIGHVLANHTFATPDEEASEIIASVSGDLASSILSTQGGYGALAQVAGALVTEAVRAMVVVPESQRQELEADQIGLFLLADAGIDPRAAVDFWTRFDTLHGGVSPTASFLSSHPANQDRIDALEALMPEATDRYLTATGRAPRKKASPAPAPGSASPPANPQAPLGSNNGQAGSEPWVVTEASTALREQPDDSSPLVRDLQKGERLVVGQQHERWFEVVSPEAGFVRGRDIAPESIANSRP